MVSAFFFLFLGKNSREDFLLIGMEQHTVWRK